MSGDMITEIAFAIYAEWSREADPRRARVRFDRLPPSVKESFEREARAAERVCRAFYEGVDT